MTFKNTNIPNFIIHYSRGRPFQSITNSSSEERDKIIKSLNEESAWGLNRFQDSKYLEKRITTENRLRNAFVERGGKTEICRPIYFFLGHNLNFEKHPENRAYRIDLSKIPKDIISFTYGDSLLSFDDEYRNLSGEKYRNSLCAKIFLLNDLDELFSSDQYPDTDPLHIEVQFWDDPLKY